MIVDGRSECTFKRKFLNRGEDGERESITTGEVWGGELIW